MRVSVILPVVDETESLRETVRILLEENRAHLSEIMIVMGKITKPEARAAAQCLSRQYPGLIQTRDQVKPFLGGAMRDAFAWATGTHLLMMASDLETNPHDVKDILAESRSGEWDIVTTTRWRGGSKAFEGYNPIKLLANWIFQKSFAMLYGTELSDLTYGFRVFKMEWVKKIRWEELRHPLLLETMLKPLRLGARVREIPTTWKARTEGESHNPFWRNFLYFRIALRTRFRSESELLAPTESRTGSLSESRTDYRKEYFPMSTALVTGGCGFVGRHLLRRLFRLQADVWCIDNLSTGLHPDEWLREATGREELPGGVIRYSLPEGKLTFIAADALAFFLGQLEIVPRGASPLLPAFDRVFHLASVVGGRKKIDGDPMEVAIDLGIDSIFFLWAVRNKATIRKVLYASSSAAYPVNLQESTGHVALEESTIDFPNGRIGMPDMTYGWSKLTGEYLSYVAAKHYGLSVACVRPFSGYGEDQDLTYPVPAIAYRAARGDTPITVWGTGEQGRDFVHIEDCVTAILLAIDRISDGRGINIGTGRLTNFKELAALFVSIAGYEAAVEPQIGKPVGVASRYSNPAEMEALLGWKPEISLEEGMARVLSAAKKRVEAGVALED